MSGSVGQAANCFVCGRENKIGLRLSFRILDDRCVSRFVPGKDHVGYPGVVHGGILYSALDDVMANWHFLQGRRVYTAKCEIRYRSPARVGEALLLEGKPESERRGMSVMTATARRERDGVLVATTKGVFMRP